MDNQFKASGIAFTLYGGFSVLIFLAVYAFGAFHLTNIDELSLFLLVLINLVLVFNFLTLLCGIYLLKQNNAVHNFALPISFLLLLSVPFGTVAGVIYLSQRFKKA